ncbi:glycosyltransferase [Arthrobacter sp. AET 35A]|uniref:glycosyltransferase n=1 Tax=Arthrobacter sp. AET 35A TaxID=2292643 RepID=UPI001CE26175|nr:glycosyltransferase [Arthrobacter sp. AET 35A]
MGTAGSTSNGMNLDVSVVIGFKDWGLDRLLLSINSIVHSFGSVKGEVIVSDYGSTQTPQAERAIRDAGAKYVYTSTDGKWSRSRALNAGFAVSGGRVLVSTDADMLFSPGSMETIAKRIISDPGEALVLQCRDLPADYSAEVLQESTYHWDDLEDASTLRPRWGMGGMMAVSRDCFLAIRGFDERMEVYGGEDMDFAQRVRWFGCRLTWIEEESVRMYHIWHPPTRSDISKTVEGVAAINANRDIVLHDKTIIRNVTAWRHKPQDIRPVASVVISTKNRSQYLEESIYSVLNQSVQDLEVLVIDDGSDDDTEKVVGAIKDDRLHFYKREAKGLASARNFAATLVRSDYTVVHDDDDIMFPDRIENHFSALHAGVHGSYGGWIDFQDKDATACMANPGREFSLAGLLFSSKILAHATIMIKSQLLHEVGYDEKLRSGSDYNLALRLARLGVVLNHTGNYHLIRRLHDRQVTSFDAAVQKGSARVSSSLALRSMRPGKQKQLREKMRTLPVRSIAGTDSPHATIERFLPDKLVMRRLLVSGQDISSLPDDLFNSGRCRAFSVRNHLEGGTDLFEAEISMGTWRDMAMLRTAGVQYSIEILGQAEDQRDPSKDSGNLKRRLGNSVSDAFGSSASRECLVVYSRRAVSGMDDVCGKSGTLEIHISATESDQELHARAYVDIDSDRLLEQIVELRTHSCFVAAEVLQKHNSDSDERVWPITRSEIV